MRRLFRYHVLPSLREPIVALQLIVVLLSFILRFVATDSHAMNFVSLLLFIVSSILAVVMWLGLHRYPLARRLQRKYEVGDDLWRNMEQRTKKQAVDWFYDIYSTLMYSRPQFAPLLREQTALGWEEWTQPERNHKELVEQVRAVQQVLAKEIMPRL